MKEKEAKEKMVLGGGWVEEFREEGGIIDAGSEKEWEEKKTRQVKMDFSKWREKKDQTERQRNEKTSEEERERKVTDFKKRTGWGRGNKAGKVS